MKNFDVIAIIVSYGIFAELLYFTGLYESNTPVYYLLNAFALGGTIWFLKKEKISFIEKLLHKPILAKIGVLAIIQFAIFLIIFLSRL